MSWTKRQFVNQAFIELGLASYQFDLSAEDLQTALRQLDAMMAAWNAIGIRVNYPLPGYPDSSDLDDETGVPDAANEAIYANLAIRIAPSFGKIVSVDTKLQARNAYNALASKFAQPGERKLPPNTPIGAGYRTTEERFTPALRDTTIQQPLNEVTFDGN